MMKNQEAPQSQSETFSGKPVQHDSSGPMSPKQDAESRQPASQNDKGGM